MRRRGRVGKAAQWGRMGAREIESQTDSGQTRCDAANRGPALGGNVSRRDGMKARKTRRGRATLAPASSPQKGEPRDGAGTTPTVPIRADEERAFAGRRAVVLLGLGLGLMVAVSYYPAVLGGFVWDDRAFTEAAPVREPSGLRQIWFSPSEIQGEGHYWPLTYTTFWLDHRLWGFAPAGFHVVNVLLHVANVILLWRLLLRLAVPGAWMIAALFAVHPVHVEAVAWVIGRKDLLATLCYLSAGRAWLRFLEEPHPSRHSTCYGLSLALFAAGLLCKSIGITLPVALLICQWWKQGRVSWIDLRRVAPFFAVGLGFAAADLSYYREDIATWIAHYSPVERVLLATHALWFYLGKLLWPTGLAVIYPHWEVNVADPLAWGYVAAAVAVVAALWFLRHRIGRGPLAGLLFFAVTLSPVLGFVSYGYMQFSFVADRYQYLAGIGPLTVVIGATAWGLTKLPDVAGKGALCLALAVLALLGTLSWRQASIYRDEITFFNHVISHNPTARNAHLNLGKALFESGRREEGLAAIRTELKLRPDFLKAHYSAGLMFLHLGRLDESERHLRRALELNPNNRDVQYSTGLALSMLERPGEAEHHYRRALQIDPHHFLAHAGLGGVLLHLDRLDESERHLRRALELNPRYPAAILNLAALQLRQKGYEEALALYRRAVEIASDNAKAWSGMGAVLYLLGRADEAVQSLDRALALDPTLELARNNREAIQASMEP